jgi:hydroxypyruvate reductase
VSLIISDVLGDPLDVIASGPTVSDTSTPEAALAVLDQFSAREAGISSAVFDCLGQSAESRRDATTRQVGGKRVVNLVIGNNATAVDAAAVEANRLGYRVVASSATRCEGLAEHVGEALAESALARKAGSGPTCTITGGEPVVKLVEASRRGLGGRNQQAVLAALARLADKDISGIALLSAGTDGEDGPTDAAGAFCDAAVMNAAKQANLDPSQFLARNDAYHFFKPLGALIHTGPTHTNVCDLRVVAAK